MRRKKFSVKRRARRQSRPAVRTSKDPPMARKRTRRFARARRFTRRHKRGMGMAGGLTGILIAGAAKPFVESYVNPMLPNGLMGAKASSLAYLLGGMLAKSRGGMVGTVGKAAFYYGGVSTLGDIVGANVGAGTSSVAKGGVSFS